MANAILIDGSIDDTWLEYDPPGAPYGALYCEVPIYLPATRPSTWGFDSPTFVQMSGSANNEFDRVEFIELAANVLNNGSYYSDWNAGGASPVTVPGWHLLRIWYDGTSATLSFFGGDGIVQTYGASDFGAGGLSVNALMFGIMHWGGDTGNVIHLGHVKIGTTVGGNDVFDFNPATAPDLSAWTSLQGPGTATLVTAPSPPPASFDVTVAGDVTLDSGPYNSGSVTGSDVNLMFHIPGGPINQIYVEVEMMWPSASHYTDLSQPAPGSPDMIEVRSTSQHFSTVEGVYLGSWLGGTVIAFGDYWDGQMAGSPAIDPDTFHIIKLFVKNDGTGFVDVDGNSTIFAGVSPLTFTDVAIGPVQPSPRWGSMIVRYVKIGSNNGLSDIFNYNPSTPHVYGDIQPATLPYLYMNNFGTALPIALTIPAIAVNLQNVFGDLVASF